MHARGADRFPMIRSSLLLQAKAYMSSERGHTYTSTFTASTCRASSYKVVCLS